jgi:hypothetical protein
MMIITKLFSSALSSPKKLTHLIANLIITFKTGMQNKICHSYLFWEYLLLRSSVQE